MTAISTPQMKGDGAQGNNYLKINNYQKLHLNVLA